MDDPEGEIDHRARHGAPADAQAARLPDDEHKGSDEDRKGEHRKSLVLKTISRCGGRVVLDFALPGDHFGFPANPGAPRGQSAIAVTEVRLCPLPRASMQPLLGVDAALAMRLAHLVALHEARLRPSDQHREP